MMEFKNSLRIPYLRFNFLIIIIVLALLTILGSTASFISIVLASFLTIGLIGANIISTLKHYDSKTILKILELSIVYFVASLIFIFLQAIFAAIFLIPVFLLKSSIDINNISSFNSGMLIVILLFLIIIFGLLVLEFIKNIGYLRYLKSKKFEDFFSFKKNMKVIFTHNFLVAFLFLTGYLVVLTMSLILVLSFLSLILPSLSNYFIGIFIVFTYYLFTSASFITFNEVYRAYK